MDIGVHALERILGRTRMLPEDVENVIAAGAYVSLGAREGSEFVLFYSPWERRAKIAIISRVRKKLISVWETSFLGLPSGVSAVTPDFCRQAELELERYILTRVKRSWRAEATAVVLVRVEVSDSLHQKRKKILYAEMLGALPLSMTMSEGSLVAGLKPQLQGLIERLDDYGNRRAQDRLRYTLRVISYETEIRVFAGIRHSRLQKQLRAA